MGVARESESGRGSDFLCAGLEHRTFLKLAVVRDEIDCKVEHTIRSERIDLIAHVPATTPHYGNSATM